MSFDLDSLKSLFDEIEKEAEDLRGSYAGRSPIHKAASEIIDLERMNYYGDSQESRIQGKVRDIIDRYAEEINKYEAD
ncbi:hypothetical protein BCT86_00835 [Vibrio breoganii]|uniref:hypothetical protein n=1 Tax=Vibrio breoganii TaxID=553239 RepID=UPI000C834E7B|nr:hypothetical protein [Vibrio breoganii]PML10546.1 hypothetical protein BCT86_00835 [Vibrio breoganii]